MHRLAGSKGCGFSLLHVIIVEYDANCTSILLR